MRILLIDDESRKRREVRNLLSEVLPSSTVDEGSSYSAAMAFVRRHNYDLVILDMRITTYDIGEAEAGGRPRNVGGEEILRKMERTGRTAPVLVLTQYTVFREGERLLSFAEFESRLSRYQCFRKMIHFGQSDDSWRLELAVAVRTATDDRNL